MCGKSSDIGAGVEVLVNLICPSLIDIDCFNARPITTVIALAFLTTSERLGGLILILVMILDRGGNREGHIGHNLGRLEATI